MESEAARSPLARWTCGDPVPLFRAATDTTPQFAYGSIGGRYSILVFLGSLILPGAAEAWGVLQRAQADGTLDDDRILAFVVTTDPEDAGRGVQDLYPGLRIFRDIGGTLSRQFGALDGEGRVATPFALLVDPGMRVLASGGLGQLEAMVATARALPPPERHGGAEIPAPVLVLPRILEPGFCQQLIAYYETRGGSPSGFMRVQDGQTIGVTDPRHKRRQDCVIEDEALCNALRARVARRLVPEIRKAFQFNATRIERYIVACYDSAEQGHFRAHRDNTTPGTAHRRFAVTINLNDAFDGGELWFPEFGPRRYRPPVGGAVVFSCSLLHEATPVTRGRRYATLPFLYDEEAARIRQANAASIVA